MTPAQRKLEKACQNARERGNRRELAIVLEELACELAEDRQWERVIEARTELLDILRSFPGEKLELARCHRFIGEAYLELRDVDHSLRHVRSYLKLAQDTSELEKQRAFTTLGRVYVAKHDINGTPGSLEKAMQFYNSALLLALQFEKDKRLGVEEARLMRGRLLYNLALASERAHNEMNSIKYLERAVYTLRQLSGSKLEKESKEDLYNTLCELSEARARLQDSAGAAEAAKAALAIGRETKNSARRGEAYMLLGMALFVGAHWRDARQALNHARVYAKNMNELKRDSLVRNLKCAVRLERWNEAIDSGEGEKNKLLENIGDTLANVGVHRQAIEAYRKIEEPFAHKCGRYAAVCGSIAETYADLGEYDSAEVWYLKEITYRNLDEHEELCSVYLSLVNCAVNQKDKGKVVEFGRKAAESAMRCRKTFTKRNAHERLTKSYTEIGLDPSEELLRNDLFYHGNGSEDNDDEDAGESSLDSSSDSSVNLSDLSVEAPSDEADRERAAAKSGARGVRTSARRLAPEKKNGLGETLLQQECIKGNLSMVNKLIAQGFDVNSTDNGGLSSLHDAANHGYLEIAKSLVEAGAQVNREGNDNSHRITPLHSAAAGGNYLIVSYLLDKGANGKALTIRGQTPFDVLEACETQDEIYISVRERLEAADAEVRPLKPLVRRRYQHITAPSPFIRSGGAVEPVIIEDDVPRPAQVRRKKQRRLDELVLRSKRARVEDEVANSSDSDSPMPSATSTQTQTRENRRQRTPPTLFKKKKQTTIFDTLRAMSDDSNDAHDNANTTIRDAFDRTLVCSTPTKDRRAGVDDAVYSDSLDMAVTEKDTTLLEAKSNSSVTSGVTERSIGGVASFSGAPVHLVRVRVEDRLLSIPLPKDFSTLTIAYLEQQAAERYLTLEGTKPVVNIALEDGALLCSSDPIVCVQGIPVLKAVVVSWNVPPLEERFKVKMGDRTPCKKILMRCQVATALGRLELDHVKIPQELMVALKHETHLHTLHLNFVHIDPSALIALAEVLAKLKNLKVLRLVGCNLRGKQLCDLLGTFGSAELEELDLSYNFVDQFFANLLDGALRKTFAGLKNVRLVSCGIQGTCVVDALKHLSLATLDLSCNPLGEAGVESAVSILQRGCLKELDISNCLSECTGDNFASILHRCDHVRVLKMNGFLLSSPISPHLDPSACNSSLRLHIKGNPGICDATLMALEDALGQVFIS
ncbi:tonsoku protein-like [Tropilaelaps mercedesae]|uniref:Tonsoku protein-like n=1 Tax=Tropilaelaps mercedesae TaxID=418985 RepID=A0A1V9XT84_9ACAR|nr:tonsoku protein-like [Tropilaelaps mercedesae]